MLINEKHRGNCLGVIWMKCMQDILDFGEMISDEDVKLKELRNYYVTVRNIDESDPILCQYANKDRINLMKEKYTSCSILKGYKLSYGKLLYDNHNVNQVEWIIDKLRCKPETKSATIVMHTPGENDLSCLSMLDFKLRKDILDMTVVYRSQNVFASQPGNFIALDNVQKYIAEKIGVNKGVMEAIILSAHIYEKDLNEAQEIVTAYNRRKK